MSNQQLSAGDLLQAFQSGELVMEPPKRGDIPGMDYAAWMAQVAKLNEQERAYEAKMQPMLDRIEAERRADLWDLWTNPDREAERHRLYEEEKERDRKARVQDAVWRTGSIAVYSSGRDHVAISNGKEYITISADNLDGVISDLQEARRTLAQKAKARAYQYQRMRDSWNEAFPPFVMPSR